MNYSELLKRLELIKNLISLEEKELLSLQVVKLMEFQSVDEVNKIAKLLQENAYGAATQNIERFIQSHRQITNYIDPEIEALKFEIKSLESIINELSNEEIDLEKLIREFGIRHNKELGELILKILYFKKEKAKGTSKQEEADNDYKKYNEEFLTAQNEEVHVLNLDEQKELREKYRKASKLCHPDVVSELQKELATKMFAELSEAYEKSDIAKVREILEALEKGNFFLSKSDTLNEKTLLKTEIEKNQLKIKELKKKIKQIKESETYKTIVNIENWDNYFLEIKQKLQSQINSYTSD